MSVFNSVSLTTALTCPRASTLPIIWIGDHQHKDGSNHNSQHLLRRDIHRLATNVRSC